MKALEILKEKKEILVRLYNGDEYSDGIDSYAKDIKKNEEAIAELEEIQKENNYIHQRMKEALSMGNKAQSLVFVELYQIIKNRTTK